MIGRVARCLLVLLASSHSTRLDARNPQEVYVREGGTLVLDPAVSQAAWSITWHCDGNLVIESNAGRVRKGYGIYTDAASRFGSDGASLQIHDWKEVYAGTYTAEITLTSRAKLARTFIVVSIVPVEVNVGQTLYLSPNLNGRVHPITWKHGPNVVVECNDGVNVFHNGTFERTAWMDVASGRLIVIGWKAYNDGIFTVERSGTKFKQFEVTTLNNVHVEAGNDLILDPRLWVGVESTKFGWRFGWMCDGDVPVPDSIKAVHDRKFRGEFECLKGRKCEYDTRTGTLTVKDWMKHEPITCYLMTRRKFHNIKVTGGYVYANFNKNFVIDPPRIEEQMTKIKWYKNGQFVVSLDWNRYDPLRFGDKWGNKAENTYLNTTTGQLTLIKLTPSRVGVLTVEINGQMMPHHFVITPLKPLDNVDVNVQPRKNCLHTGSCELVCDGDTQQAEPVNYFWRQKTNKGSVIWVKGSKYMPTHALGGGQYSINACKITNGASERQTVFFGPVVNVEVEIGTSLYLDPEFTGTIRTIVWKNGDDVAITCEDGVDDGANVVYHGTFRRTTRMTNWGKLIVSDWKPFQQNVFTVEINGGEHVKKFRVANIVRVPVDSVLNFNPKLETFGTFRRYNWFLDGTEILRVICDFVFVPTQKGMERKTEVIVDQFGVCRPEGKNCSWDDATGKLTTTKPWDIDGELTLAIDDEKQNDKIKLVTRVVYVPNGNQVTVKVNRLDSYKGGRIVIGDCLDWATTGGCTLVCDEDVDGAEPVKYSWRVAKTGKWVEGTKHMETKYGVNRFIFDTCKMKNPLGEKTINE